MSPLLKIEKHKHPEKIVVYFEAKLNDIAYKGSISWRWWAIFIPAANTVAGIRAEDEIIIFGFFLCPVWEGRYALGGVHSKVSVISVQFAVEHEIERRKGYDKSIYLEK